MMMHRSAERASLELALELYQSLERFEEIFEGLGGKHDRVAPTTDIFGDLKETASLVFFEVEEEDLPFDRDFLGRDWIGAHSFPGILVHHKLQLLTCATRPDSGRSKRVFRLGSDWSEAIRKLLKLALFSSKNGEL